jgi:hypothetical protein
MYLRCPELLRPLIRRVGNVNPMANLLARLFVLSLAVAVTGFAQDSASWNDPSQHKVQFVTVEEGVRLEVLDWGGTGFSWGTADPPLKPKQAGWSSTTESASYERTASAGFSSITIIPAK